MDFLGCLNDRSLGPTIQGCRDDFDFTIKFELVIFSILPASVFAAICIARTTYLAARPALVGGHLLQSAKIASILVYSACQLSLLILSSTTEGVLRIYFVSSSALTFIAALFMIVVSWLEHLRSPRPSMLLTAYLSLSLLLDAAHTRTLWLASTTTRERVFTKLFTGAVAMKFIVMLLEAQQKAKWVRWDAKEHSPEETSGLYDLSAFLWLNRLFLAGYQKTLSLDDLFPLDCTMASGPLQADLSRYLDREPLVGKRHGLARALAKSLTIPLLLPVGPRIAMTAFQFCQPFLINLLLDYLQKPHGESAKNIGYGLIGASFLIYTGIALSGAFYWYLQERVMYMIRAVLAGVVYKKVVEAKLSAEDDNSALTLMSADIERIIMGGLNLHEFWANTIQVGLASWLLWRQIGPAAIAPLIVVLCSVMLSSVLSKFTGQRQKAWMENIQKRVGQTANAIRQMKHLKISGLATTVGDLLQLMRVNELKTASRFRMIITFAAVIANVPLCISPVVTFIFASRTLSVTTIFTSISYVLLLATPLSMVLQMMPAFLSAFTCLERIQKFLERESRVDYRKPVWERQGPQKTAEHSKSVLMEISGGSFGWQIDKHVISEIDLQIPASQLTMIVGPVGSGKSTLCKALIGEAPFAQGRIHINTWPLAIGYCDQTPYLANLTVRENIVGFAPFDQGRYDEVLQVTGLKPDLESLPLGDGTNVGSNGITLSGGQKQRVALARALYLDSTFLIFDDILSGLDANTAEHVFREVFSPRGLLRRRGVTAVLCTHAVRRLPSADHVIALGPDGKLVEQGTFTDLMAQNGYICGLRIEESEASSIREDEQPVNPVLARGSDTSLRRPTGQLPPSFGDEQKRITGDISVYRYYLSRINTASLVVFVAFGAGWGFFSNFTTIWLKFWSEDVNSSSPARSGSFYLGLYAVFQVSTLCCLLCVCLVCFKSMIKVSGSRLHKEALDTVVNAPLRFFTSTDTGIVVNLFSQDMNLIDGELPLAFINLTNRIFTSVGMAAVVATSSAYLVITFPILAVVLYGIQKFYLRTSRQIRLLDLEAKSPLYSQFIDTIKGVATIRALGWVNDVMALNNKLLDRSQRPAYLLAMIQRWLQFVLQLVVAALATIVVALATQLQSNSAFAGASLVTLMTFGHSLSFLIRVYTVVETSIGAVSRLKTFSESVKPENLPGEDVLPPPEWPMRGSIEIKGVSASYEYDRGLPCHQTRMLIYRSREMENEMSDCAYDNHRQKGTCQHLVLADVNIRITAGEKVAICGRTGSGKSSIILLLLRLLDPLSFCKQEILIDNMSLSRINRSTLRHRIIAVPQDPVFLLDGTSIHMNLDPQGQSTEAECLSVMELVNLRIIIEERGGLSGPLAPDTLSQGQRQLFSLARAILRHRIQLRAKAAAIAEKNASRIGGVLLLDEFSSSVDQDTERLMHKVVSEEFETYTVLMVSHRLDIVMTFDTVIVMHDGRVVETGRPQNLVHVEGSRFKELWETENKRQSM